MVTKTLRSRQLPTQEYLLSILSYDPATGIVYSLRAVGNHSAGDIVGSGRRLVIDGHAYYLYHIIWKMMTGEDPPVTVDHRDTDETNNRWINLRLADYSIQNINRKLKPNETGHRGVYKNHRGYRIQISFRDKSIWKFGFFSLEEAVAERTRLASEMQKDALS